MVNIDGLIADLAIAFHWQPSEIFDLTVDDLIIFRELAQERMPDEEL